MTLHRGKIARAPTIGLIRPLTREDLGLLRERVPGASAGIVQKLRDPHHRVARLMAAGFRPEEVAWRSGYSIQRIGSLIHTPAFVELVAKYRDKVDAKFLESIDDFKELAIGNMIKAERMTAEKLEEHEEEGTYPPIRDLIAISRDAADRFGYGKHQTNVNVNVDYAAKLEQTIARSKGVTIEAERVPTLAPQPPTPAKVVPAYQKPGSAHPTLPMILRRA